MRGDWVCLECGGIFSMYSDHIHPTKFEQWDEAKRLRLAAQENRQKASAYALPAFPGRN